MSAGVKAGIAVGVVLGVAILALLSTILWRVNNPKKRTELELAMQEQDSRDCDAPETAYHRPLSPVELGGQPKAVHEIYDEGGYEGEQLRA